MYYHTITLMMNTQTYNLRAQCIHMDGVFKGWLFVENMNK